MTIRYAVVAQGYISQVAILPAFAHAKKNFRLVALVSGDPVKLDELSKRQGIERCYKLIDFSDCVLNNKNPEPSGREGLADVRVIEVIYESARTGRAIKLGKFERETRPSLKQKIKRPPVKKPDLVNASPPSG